MKNENKCPEILESRVKDYLMSGFWQEYSLLDEADSTNSFVKRLAESGKRGCYAVAALRQTSGRGRREREFISSAGGIYLSMAYDIPMAASEAGLITVFASVAVSDAIKEVLGVDCSIKWVNDLYLGSKKVCGILTEGRMNAKGQFDWFVVGVGINVFSPEGGFTGAAEDVAGALCDFIEKEDIPEHLYERLTAAVLNRMRSLGGLLPERAYLPAYRERSMLLGKPVTVYKTIEGDAEQYPAAAVGIDDDGRLLVRDASGELHTLSSGEVSIRLRNPEEQDCAENCGAPTESGTFL